MLGESNLICASRCRHWQEWIKFAIDVWQGWQRQKRAGVMGALQPGFKEQEEYSAVTLLWRSRDYAQAGKKTCENDLRVLWAETFGTLINAAPLLFCGVSSILTSQSYTCVQVQIESMVRTQGPPLFCLWSLDRSWSPALHLSAASLSWLGLWSSETLLHPEW